ncbi:hypothetical protein F0562_004212 [Nyssa sinensis]|uniref:SMP domain-containing protein n=1 Tax=Nyssa sinensis TaxID=561372 RepID=A0A5J5BX93_9ASTE|nr:hypothetical protein F0562_004212 [Nyssa sinensis]
MGLEPLSSGGTRNDNQTMCDATMVRRVVDGNNFDETGSEAQLENAEAAGNLTSGQGRESGGKAAGARLTAVAVEQGDKGGGCRPELKGEAF